MRITTATCALVALSLALLPGCSIKQMAINALGDALAGGTSGFATDEDPELVREAVPFGLKTIESLLAEAPEHKGLLLAAASGFTQYGYAYLQQDADFVEDEDYEAAVALRKRAKGLYRRGLDYGMRGLEVDIPGFRQRLTQHAGAALEKTRKKHVPLLAWTGLAWAAAMSIAKDDSELTVNQDLAEAMMRRALELDESYDYGSVHDFFISYEGGRQSVGGSLEKAKHHFERAMELGQQHRAWPLVSYVEAVSISAQDRGEFDELLNRALEIDTDRIPELRLTNLIAQKRARWLLGRADDLFIE